MASSTTREKLGLRFVDNQNRNFYIRQSIRKNLLFAIVLSWETFLKKTISVLMLRTRIIVAVEGLLFLYLSREGVKNPRPAYYKTI